MTELSPLPPSVRLDIWLWAARFFKTRSLAKQAIETGKVSVAGQRPKSSRAVRVGEQLQVDRGEEHFEIQVLGLSDQRGPAPAAQSYLLADKIVEAVRQTGAQAVHPGFGFLSENAGFARRLREEGIAFIGPNPEAIEAMGDKISSKKLAAEAGVSTVPGHMGLIVDADEAVKISDQIGYPVMIKAVAGGGGRGLRVAHNEVSLLKGYHTARTEAEKSFGLKIETWVQQLMLYL